MFVAGPWPWPVPDSSPLYLYLFCAQLALWLGYRFGLCSRRRGYYGRWKINSIIKTTLILNLFWIIPNYMLRMNIETFNPYEILNFIIQGFVDPGDNYLAKADALSVLERSSYLTFLSLLLSPVRFLLVPLAVFYWSRLTRVVRCLFVLFVIIDLLSWVAIGTNKGIADYLILLPWLIVARRPELIVKIRPAKALKFLVIVFLGFVLLFSFFSFGIYGRGYNTIPTYYAAADIEMDRENWMVRLLPHEGQGAVGMFMSYVVQGYYGLSLALQEPFTSSYGVGNSFYLTSLGERILGEGVISERTYPSKIERYGWDRLRHWHSFYTWIASDVSFPGSIVIVFLVGQLFAVVWLDVLRKTNPFAVALFALLIIMLFYFPANNQVLAFSDTANSFIVILPLWLLSRRKVLFINRNLMLGASNKW